MKRIIFTGGGTAGHIYPALAIAENFSNYELHYIGGNGMEKEILKHYPNIIYHEIPTVKLERKLTFKNFLIPFKLAKSVKITKILIKNLNPNIVFSKGGFVSVPVAIASKSLKIPLISHESDLSFGLANKIILQKCDIMCTTFEETSKNKKKCVYTGQPIRKKIFTGTKKYKFNNEKPTLLVLGGSLGAKFLNDIIFGNIEKLTKNFNILHICGKNNFKEIKYKDYLIFPYAENIEDLYASADLVLSRAGSGVINEVLSLQKPMLLIPLSKKCSRGDQIENAKLFEEKGYATVLCEEKYNFDELINKLNYLIKNKEKIIKNMKNTAKTDAVNDISKIILNYI